VERELRRQGLWSEDLAAARREWFRRWIDLMKTRARTVTDLAADGRPYLTDDFAIDPQAERKYVKDPEVGGRLEALAGALGTVGPFVEAGIEAALRAEAERLSVPAAKLIHPARVAVTGKEVGPGIFEVLALLGKERTLERLRRFASRIAQPPS
jgi:glutamyl-tRNA synthetase